jgi:hypothetical protein
MSQFADISIRLLDKSIHLDPLNPELLAQKILLLRHTGNIVEALSTIEKMELLTPGNPILNKLKSMLISDSGFKQNGK